MLLTACSSGSKSPSDAGQIIVQTAPDLNSTNFRQMDPSTLNGPSFNLGPSFGGLAISPTGTPVPGSAYFAGRSNNLYRINPGGSPVSIPIAAQARGHIQIAPPGAKNAGAAVVLTDQGISTLQPGGTVTNIPIPDPASLVLAAHGAPNAGTAYVTSKTTSSLYIIDPLATTAHAADIGIPGGDLVAAPTKTPDAGTVFAYPDPDQLDGGTQPVLQLAAISPSGAVQTAPLPQGTQISGTVVAAVAPAKTPHAGSLYFAGSGDTNLYLFSATAGLTSIPLLPSSHNPSLREMLIADAGTNNGGDVYISSDQGVTQIDPSGHSSTVIPGTAQNAPTLLAIAPANTPTAGIVYVATAVGTDGTVKVINPDGSQATFQLPDQIKPSSGIVAPAGTKLAGTLLTWGFYGQGIGTISPKSQTGQLGYFTEITDVMVVPK